MALQLGHWVALPCSRLCSCLGGAVMLCHLQGMGGNMDADQVDNLCSSICLPDPALGGADAIPRCFLQDCLCKGRQCMTCC